METGGARLEEARRETRETRAEKVCRWHTELYFVSPHRGENHRDLKLAVARLS
jgi:hypothetical protein